MHIQYATPESLGLSSENIIEFYDRLKNKHVPMQSVILYRKNAVVSEAYYAPFQKQDLHRMFSISKTLTGIGIGLLADRGLLNLSDPIIRYFPDKLPTDKAPSELSPYLCNMTIRDLLMMRTCHSTSTYDKFHPETDWVGSFFTTPPTHKSGTIWHYDTAAAHVLCALVERLTGETLVTFLRKELAPLDFLKEAYMLTDGQGVSMGGTGLVATTEDLLKLGIFFLQKGNIDGVQLLSRDFLEEACSNLTPNAVAAPLPSEAGGYGYMLWMSERGGYVCYGMGGQFVIIHPKEELLLITTSDTQGIAGGNQIIYDAFYDTILSKLEPGKVQAGDMEQSKNNLQGKDCASDMEVLSKLRELEKSMKMEPAKDMIQTPFQGSQTIDLSEKKYRLVPNKSDFQSISFHLSAPGKYILLFEQMQEDVTRTYEIPFGMQELLQGTFPIYEMRTFGSGVWLDAHTLYLRFQLMDTSVGSIHMEFYFEGTSMTLYMKKIEETLFTEFQGHFNGELQCE